jgi:stage V sporulation protein S
MDVVFNNFELDDIKPAPSYPPDLDATAGAIIAPHGELLEQDTDLATEILKVSSRSRPSAVAGAIAGVVRGSGRAEVQAIGAGATNQAVKAVAIARDYLNTNGLDIVCIPAFIDVTIGEEDRTAIRLIVEPR